MKFKITIDPIYIDVEHTDDLDMDEESFREYALDVAEERIVDKMREDIGSFLNYSVEAID